MNRLKRCLPALSGILLLAAHAAAAPKKAAGKKTAAPPAPAAEKTPASTAKLLDNFEAVDWSMAKHDGTEISLDRADGREGKALQIAYDLKDTGQWVQVYKPFAIDDFKGKALEFWVKGSGASNTLEVKLVDTDGSNFGVKKPGLTALPDWTPVRVEDGDLTYWWGGDKAMGLISEIYFAVSAGNGGAGKVLLDDLRLVSAEGGLGESGVVTRGDTVAGWETALGQGAKAKLSTGAGQDGKALALDYEIPANQWVSVRKTINTSVGADAAILLKLRGEGDLNNVEVKLLDRDESTFGKTLEGLAGDSAWQEVRLPLSELKYFWGGDDKLDLSLIRHFEIAVSGPGGKGTVFIDEVRIAR